MIRITDIEKIKSKGDFKIEAYHATSMLVTELGGVECAWEAPQ